MIDRLLFGVQRVIAGVIGVVLLFGLLVGLIVWAKNDPAAVQALVVKVINAAISVIVWLCDLVVRAAGQGGE